MKNKLISLFYILLNFLAFGNVLNLNTNHLPHIEKLSQTDILFQQLSQTIELNDKNSAKNLPLTQEFYTYTVKPNEDLLTIHAATNIPYDTIATLNGINDTSENITNKTIIIPSMKGLFISKKPKSSLEILLYEENNFLL